MNYVPAMRSRADFGVILEQIWDLLEFAGYINSRTKWTGETRIVQDLGIDSLDIVELVLAIEEEFEITWPDNDPNREPVLEKIFVKPDFSVNDLAEMVYLQWGRNAKKNFPKKSKGGICAKIGNVQNWGLAPFTQKDSDFPRNKTNASSPESLFEELPSDKCADPNFPTKHFRRQTDGMVVVALPSAEVSFEDQSRKRLDAFLIDIEPVSTAAYCRFLNSVNLEEADELAELWFKLPHWDRRRDHELISFDPIKREWSPHEGVESWPMVLVSWFGASAYSLWANDQDWMDSELVGQHLPTISQFEYAARGPEPKNFPWGNDCNEPYPAQVEQHKVGARYPAAWNLPLLPVNAELGVSPFGLRHMAGNVWNWLSDEIGETGSGHRAEKAGSWIGSIQLASCNYTRGRLAEAKGRCLGFRCVSNYSNSAI